MNNVTGMNFYKTQNKQNIVTNSANQFNNNDLRSSSAYDQRVHSVGKRVGIEDKLLIGIPKYLRNKVNFANLDIVIHVLRQDKLRDELIKLKVEYNIKIKDYNTLRVDYIRLEVIIYI